MTGPVTAVEPNHRNPSPAHLGPTQPGGERPAAPQSARFTYPSGSSPLAGYTIRRGIGHGGFGEVYYATSDAGKEVALKLIRRNLEVELRGMRHCLNLKHPNLLSLHDIRTDDQGDTWVMMEYITGQCLQDVVAAHPNGMPVDQALAWIHGIGAGVACLHDHGIVHRDLKPGNIFADEGLVKIGDYGLSKYISCSRRSGQTESVGTVHYMAPEVANGRYGKEIDVYAMGVIFYEMLIGRVPFEGESVGEVLMKHLTATPDVSMLPEPYRSVIAKALDKDPQRRFGSAAAMLAGLPAPSRPQVHAGPLPSAPASLSGAAAGAPYVTPAVVQEASDEEPIWRAIRRGARRAHDAWNESKLNTPTKIALLVAGIFVLLAMAHSLVPLMIALAILYGCYWVVRAVLIAFGVGSKAVAPVPPGQPPGAATAVAQEPAVPAPASPPPSEYQSKLPKWYCRRERPAEALVLKPPRERVIELLGSLLGGALVAMTMSLVMVILASFHAEKMFQPEQCAWLVLVGIAGTWAVMVMGKFWEGSRGDAALRWFISLVVGLGLGLWAFGVARFLQVIPPYDPRLATLHLSLPPNFYDPSGQPRLLAYLAYYGTLFALIRWWRQADPLRRTRMSLWSLTVSALLAWIVANLWQFPQSWPIMVACTISASVQLASPWLHPRERSRREYVP